MLYTDPLPVADPSVERKTIRAPRGQTRIFQRRRPDIVSDATGEPHEFEAKAFHWGSLTTGDWLTAFWILLGPFAFSNVAGWMTRWNKKISFLGIRIAGMGLTALFVAQLGYLFLVIPLEKASDSWKKPTVLIAVLIYLVLFVFGIVLLLSTRTHFERFGFVDKLRLTMGPRRRHLLPPPRPNHPLTEAEIQRQWDDPAGSPITDESLWNEHAILHRIRRLHLSFGVLVITGLVALGVKATTLRWPVYIGSALVVLLMIGTTYFPKSTLVQMLTAWMPIISLAIFAVSYWVLANDFTGTWNGYHYGTYVTGLALGVGAAGALLAGPVAMGSFVIGALFGASIGTGLGFFVESLTGVNQLTEKGAGWVAVAMLFLVLTIIITALVLSLSGDRLPEDGWAMALLRRVTTKARWIMIVAAAYGVVFALVALYFSCFRNKCGEGRLDIPVTRGTTYIIAVIGFASVIALAAVSLRSFKSPLKWAGLAVAAILVVLFAIGKLPSGTVSGLEIDFNDLVALSKALVILLPFGLILRSVLGSIQSGTSSRQVGVIWDVASMWPRWFHPLAPPAYGPKVTHDLGERLTEQPIDLLEAHSQGSVIAAVTMHRLPPEVTPPAFVTYGSPLGLLYKPLFPETGIGNMITELETRLEGRWVNLWRPTDPLGGKPIGLAEGDVEVDEGTGHSTYELTLTFRNCRLPLVERD